LAPFGKHYEFEAFMEKAVGVIRVNAIDAETRRMSRKSIILSEIQILKSSKNT
jgi:hypothetical protein